MAGATIATVKMLMPLPLRFQGLRASEPTLRRRAPSGSPPLLFSSGNRPRCLSFPSIQSLADLCRCDWVGHHSGAPVAPPAAESETGAPPHLEGNHYHHCLHLGHLFSFMEELEKASPTRPRGGGHRVWLEMRTRFFY